MQAVVVYESLFGNTEEFVHRLGYPAAARAESFYFQDISGPLLKGELDRALAWGVRLGSDAVSR
jgi:hypothetical protein